MYGMKMSEMEKLLIHSLVKTEDLCTKKVQMYLTQTRDPVVQSMLQQSLDMGQRHVSVLNGLLQESGVSGMAGH